MLKFIKITIPILLLTLTCQSQVMEKPNIILIVTDDQRWDALGYAGNSIIQTPHMDRLAGEGTYFPNAFVTTPICAASRASIITGMYERTHQFTFRTPPLQNEFIDVGYPKLLKDAGYHLGFFGKFGMTFQDQRDTLLFDELWTARTEAYFRLQGPGWKDHVHLTDLTTDKALQFLKDAPGSKPFCLSISYNAPHADDTSPQQYFWPERNDHLYQDVQIPIPELADSSYFRVQPQFIQDPLNMSRIRWKWRFENPEKFQRMVKGYYRMISTIDDNLGRIREVLEETGQASNTVIMLIGDNGYFLGERGLAGKWYMYENSIRVPLIILDPRQSSTGKVVEEMALNIDLNPTMLDLAGVEIPSIVQGQSLRGLMEGKRESWRESFLCEHLYELEYIPQSEGVRTNQWKYFRYRDHPETQELYDLEKDPMEKENLANQPEFQNQLQQMKKLCDQTIESVAR